MFSAGVGVVFFFKLLESESGFQKCWSLNRFFKPAGVGVGFSKLLESESVFQNCWSRNPKKSSDSTTLPPGAGFMINCATAFEICTP